MLVYLHPSDGPLLRVMLDLYAKAIEDAKKKNERVNIAVMTHDARIGTAEGLRETLRLAKQDSDDGMTLSGLVSFDATQLEVLRTGGFLYLEKLGKTEDAQIDLAVDPCEVKAKADDVRGLVDRLGGQIAMFDTKVGRPEKAPTRERPAPVQPPAQSSLGIATSASWAAPDAPDSMTHVADVVASVVGGLVVPEAPAAAPVPSESEGRCATCGGPLPEPAYGRADDDETYCSLACLNASGDVASVPSLNGEGPAALPDAALPAAPWDQGPQAHRAVSADGSGLAPLPWDESDAPGDGVAVAAGAETTKARPPETPE